MTQGVVGMAGHLSPLAGCRELARKGPFPGHKTRSSAVRIACHDSLRGPTIPTLSLSR